MDLVGLRVVRFVSFEGVDDLMSHFLGSGHLKLAL